ncbi:uncharacterized protein LOC135210477 [Macrobrachium nipponense]|uniref:uncharacterized protein LOC135210477 n=1 Tax=Macrobrachium nipponense TaxID=159736 RepID=UPI0030C7AD16
MREVDFSFAPFNVLYTRAQAADYTVPFVIEYGRILARKGETEVDPWAFFLPLTPTVWLLLLACMGIIILCSLALTRILNASKTIFPRYSWENYVRTFLSQDTEFQTVKEWSLSILVATWLIALLIALKAYAGNLNSLLIARHVPQPYHTVRAVVDNPRIKVLWVAGGSYLQILKSFESGVFKELADAGEKGKISFMGSTSLTEIVNTKVSSGDYVMVIDDSTMKTLVAEHFSRSGTCLFYLSRELFFPLMVAMVAQKYSPLIPVLDKRIIMINEGGLYDHWTRNEIQNYTNCAKAPSKILFQSALSLQSLWVTGATATGCFFVSGLSGVETLSRQLSFDGNMLP